MELYKYYDFSIFLNCYLFHRFIVDLVVFLRLLLIEVDQIRVAEVEVVWRGNLLNVFVQKVENLSRIVSAVVSLINMTHH